MLCKKLKIIFFLLFIVFVLKSQDISYRHYISENLLEFDESDTIAYKDAYNKYRLFALGEHHYRKENSEFFITVFKNLYYNANVRVIFLESSFAHGLIFEHYLKTGDDSSLYKITNIGQFSLELYKKLKDFYDELPGDGKFHILGIDVDNYDVATNFAYAVGLLFQEDEMPKKLKVLLDEFSIIAPPADKRNNKIFEEIYSDFTEKPEYYKSILNENYNVYRNLLNRVKGSITLRYYDYNNGQDSIPQTIRENYIYNNVVNAIKNYPDYNYFAQFGLAHIGLTRFLIIPEENPVESFMAKLNNWESSPIKGQVCTTAILYYTIKIGDLNLYNYKLLYYFTQLRYANSRKAYLPGKVYRIIKRTAEKDKMYVLKMDNDGSPLWDIAEKNFQYLILSR